LPTIFLISQNYFRELMLRNRDSSREDIRERPQLKEATQELLQLKEAIPEHHQRREAIPEHHQRKEATQEHHRPKVAMVPPHHQATNNSHNNNNKVAMGNHLNLKPTPKWPSGSGLSTQTTRAPSRRLKCKKPSSTDTGAILARRRVA
jgi:hypothetical protein